MKKEELTQALKKLEKVMWEWKTLHSEVNEVILEFEKLGFKEGYKLACKFSEEESRLIEEAQQKFQPLIQELKEKINELKE